MWDHTTVCEVYSFTIDEYGIFNGCAHLGADRTHKGGGGGSGTIKSAQELTLGGIEKLFLTLFRQGIEPRVFGFEFRRTNR